MTHFGNGTVAVIAEAFHQNRHTTRTVTFVGDLLHIGIITTTTATLNSTVDGVAGHVRTQRLINRRSQTRVIIHITTTRFGSDHQLTNQLGENFASLGILSCFTMLDVGPFTMTGHRKSSIDEKRLLYAEKGKLLK